MTAKILVADDSITIQKIVAMAFENEDATVEGIGNGSEALDRLKTFKPNVVLADIDMPGLTGFELSREIKESSELNSIHVLLLASDFEEFDENLFEASLADNHITKPFKSEDLVRKVMGLLGEDSPVLDDDQTNEEDEEMEEVIELTVADRVVEDTVIDSGEGQRMDSHDGISLEGEDAVLDLPHDHELTGLDDEDAELEAFYADIGEGFEEDPVLSDPPQEEDLLVDVGATLADQAEMETTGREEDLDEFLLKVEELSRKSEEISENGHHEKLSPMEAIDEVLKEVSALKKEEPLSISAEEENVTRENTEPKFSTDPAQSEAVLEETDFFSEENAEALATAFDDITNGNEYPFPAIKTEPFELEEPFLQEDGVETESTQKENSPPNFEETTSACSNGKTSSSKEKFMTTGDDEANLGKSGESLLPAEDELKELMEKEVRRVVQQSLTPLIEKEISGLSEKILHAVEENVRQVTPGIAKTIIEKEIDKIKTMEDG
jgi:CheY-like chemotaxis protein